MVVYLWYPPPIKFDRSNQIRDQILIDQINLIDQTSNLISNLISKLIFWYQIWYQIWSIKSNIWYQIISKSNLDQIWSKFDRSNIKFDVDRNLIDQDQILISNWDQISNIKSRITEIFRSTGSETGIQAGHRKPYKTLGKLTFWYKIWSRKCKINQNPWVKHWSGSNYFSGKDPKTRKSIKKH